MIPSDALTPLDRPCSVQAKQLLQGWFGVPANQAEALIARWARHCRRSPEAVAHVLVHQVWQGDQTAADPVVARTLEHALRNLPGVVSAGMDPETAVAPESH